MKTGFTKNALAALAGLALSSTPAFGIESPQQESLESCVARMAKQLLSDRTGKFLPWDVPMKTGEESRAATAANFCSKIRSGQQDAPQADLDCVARIAKQLISDRTGRYMPWNIPMTTGEESRAATAANFCSELQKRESGSEQEDETESDLGNVAR